MSKKEKQQQEPELEAQPTQETETAETPEAIALRDRIGDLFQRAEGTMN